MSSKLELPINSDWPAMLKALSSSGVVARGLGRSYNDAAQLSGGSFIDTTIWNHVVHFDPSSGILKVEAGASLDQIMREFADAGFFVPVTPGTRHVTIGGAIACDVHGKNHHKDGTFTDHVLAMDLATPSGIMTLTREHEPELFNATCGGMGLTGVILNATVRMLRIESVYMKVDTIRTNNLDEVLDLMESEDHKYRYSVAWVDSLARGSSLGRAVLTRGNHADLSELEGGHLKTPLDFKPKTIFSAPDIFPSGLLNSLTIKAFNEVWYKKTPRKETGAIHHAASFFHPLDIVGNWNRIYGPRGFIQYQFVVPFGREDVLRNSLELLANNRAGSFLTVLKRFGKSNAGLISFPMEGWTLALDLPVGPANLAGLFDQLDEMILKAGGRVYLAKDARVSKNKIKLMYPHLDEFRKILKSVDPTRIIQSDLSRRLGI
ncbi:MAG: FAD-binding oxidoreductase [Acidimicrobiaceae bacterium]|nr:FAD-binding oxidoreductase [Acidimicrobiaceae bacterium]